MNTQAQKTADRKPPLYGSLDLSKFEGVLVKFFFTNSDHVPRGIPHISRTSSYALDFGHRQEAIAAGKPELGELGRHRPDRNDTGEPVIRDAHGAQASLLKDRLVKEGFALKNLHWMEQRKQNRPTKFVVVVEFARGTQQGDLPQSVIDELDYLSHMSRWTCHVWDNSALGDPATINFVGRQPDAKPQWYITAVDGKIEPIKA